MNRKEMLATLAGAPLAVLALAREARAGKDETPLSPAREAIRARYFPNVVLTTHEGKRVRFFDDLIRDKIAVIGLMYANCQGVCPAITANLVKVQKLLGDRVGRDIFLYSVTVKPEED